MRTTNARPQGTIVCLFIWNAAFALAQVQTSPPAASTIPPEETRFSPAIFREGLKKRGLIELLEQHLKEYPPAGPSAAALMNREIKLAEFADRTRPLDERRAAIAEANRLLQQLIEENPKDLRAIDWRLTLAHSLLYEDGESYATNLLYFGGTASDRRLLTAPAALALSTMRDMIKQIEAENARIDSLSAADFDKLEQSGIVEKLDRLRPSAEYLLLWALFYDALPREEKDPLRAQELTEIVKTFSDHPEWLATPQEKSHVQIPALLLAGMAQRRLANFTTARQHFDRAASEADRLIDDTEKSAMQWAVVLIALESGRNAADDRRFDAALAEVARLRGMPAVKASSQYGARLAAALLERSVLLARADSADKAGRSTDARKFREDAWRSLDTLAKEEPQNRPLLYSTLYRPMSTEADATSPRDPVEVSALLAGLLDDAAKDESRKSELLQRVIREGDQFLSQATGAQRSVAPEILYQMGIAHYRLGQSALAAEKMLEIARKYPNYGQASEAAVVAVQLAAQQCADLSNCTPRSPNHQLYRAALEALLSGFPKIEAARYWRFYYAQLLEDAEDYTGAAVEYARVDREHEHYLESAFRRVRATSRASAQLSSRDSVPTADLLASIDAVNAAYRDFISRAAAESPGIDGERAQRSQEMLGEARLLLAESFLLHGVNRPQQAIDLLVDFERTLGPQSPLLGRMWNVRLRALEALGRLDEASRAVPEFVAADPRNAGPTLQSLYLSMMADWRRQASSRLDSQSGTTGPANSDMMLLIAGQILKWSQRDDVKATPAQRREAAIQYADAHLMVGKAAQARDLYQPLQPDAQTEPSKYDSLDLRAAIGHAEALLQSGDPAKALPEFNRLATTLPPEHPIRWQALLGDLEARTELVHPPDGILRVIAQQRRLFPTLGGPENAARFDRLERENTRRRDQKP